ncbi:DUF6796 family protein [Ruminococcus flavefaciens]|jgi:hypothetical protein|uniref:DUF6796 family protein n=1 Tax=Ruminococcus flavefaciens TaxID=1265 RepID=UPI00048B6D31|nr:DUF6796 family protein [Ruminococcus flavefaciens]
MDRVIGIIGIISGFMCALADTPLAYFYDENNQKIGQRRDIQTGWQTASSKRFYLSFLLSFLGQPGCYLVMWRLAEMIGKENDTMCSILKICTFLGCYTGLITHAVFCIKPLVYKHIYQEASLKTSETALHETDRLTILPVLVCSFTLIIIPAFLISAAIWQGILPVSRLWIIFNPIFLMIAMLAVKKAFPKLPLIGFMGTGFIVYSALLLTIS